MPEHTIHLIGGEDGEKAVVTYAPRDRKCHVVFRYRNRVIEECALDYFEALCRVRLSLEMERLIPFCYGASLNVYPSGMCRDMGAGLVAYRLTFGKHTDPIKDSVKIFEHGPDVIPSTVALQREHYDEWLKSRRA